jgi:hypothetical protein
MSLRFIDQQRFFRLTPEHAEFIIDTIKAAVEHAHTAGSGHNNVNMRARQSGVAQLDVTLGTT